MIIFGRAPIANEPQPLQGAISKGPRYAVYDFEYKLASGEGSRNKVTFIAWSPDDAGIKVRSSFCFLPTLFKI